MENKIDLDKQIDSLEKMLASARLEKLHKELKQLVKTSDKVTFEVRIYGYNNEVKTGPNTGYGNVDQRMITFYSMMDLTKLVDYINDPKTP